jgi:hypothetical protein
MTEVFLRARRFSILVSGFSPGWAKNQTQKLSAMLPQANLRR